MQSVSAAFTAEARDSTRRIAQGVLVSWKKSLLPSIRLFTIGVSTIGGNDIIAGTAGVVSAWNKYQYDDETEQVMSIDYERSLNMPLGGLAKALADVRFNNTSGRYTPHYMGGISEISTAILPRRPIIIDAGFNYGGVDNTIPQFVGIGIKQPSINRRNATMDFAAADFNDFLQNRYLDQTTMFTGLRTDEVIEARLQELGYGTSQYELDPGINLIPFGLFEKGTRYADIINELVQAEYGHFYQDEEGKLRFENRQHWDASPHNNVQMIITTNMVLNAETPNEDHIINVVEIKSKPRIKRPDGLVWKLAGTLELPIGDTEFFVDFDDPMLAVTSPTNYIVNTETSGDGTDVSSSVSIKEFSLFAKAAKIVFTNSYPAPVFLIDMKLFGRAAVVQKEIYLRTQDDSSVTAFEERPILIENDYIQSESWANSLAQLILNDYAEIENLQEITIQAQPQLQLGDLISWQGRYWRIFGIISQIDPSFGFVQTLKLLQRTVNVYFRIGISTIGESHQIAP